MTLVVPEVLASWVVLAVAWRASFALMQVRRLDATYLYMLLFGLLIVFRSGLLSLGLDTPFPDKISPSGR